MQELTTTSSLDQLEQRREQLQQKIEKLENQLFDDNAATIKQLQAQKSELKKKLNTLTENLTTLSSSNLKPLLDKISEQRWWFIDNHPEILFDSHTGYLWPNLDHYTLIQGKKSLIKSINLDNRTNWEPPIPSDIGDLQTDRTFPFKEMTPFKNNQIFCRTDTLDVNSFGQDNHYFLFPCHTTLASNSFTPPPRENIPSKSQLKTKKTERAQKLLNLFKEQQWQLTFADDETQLANTYENYTFELPKQKQQLIELNQKISEVANANPAPITQISYSNRKRDYNANKIDATPSAYVNGLGRWLHALQTDLNECQKSHPKLFFALNHINQQMQKNADTLPNGSAQRHRFLQQRFDFELHSVATKLTTLQNNVNDLQQQLDQIDDNPLATLHNLNQQPRPPFEVVADYSADLLVTQLKKIDWYNQHQNLIDTLITHHQNWLQQSQNLHNDEINAFQNRCQEELIETNLSQRWQTEWLRFHEELENKLLTLMQIALDGHLDSDRFTALVEALQRFRDDGQHLHSIEQLSIHQQCDLDGSDPAVERLEFEIKFTELTHTLQEQLEKSLITLPNNQAKQQLYHWAESWLSHQFNDSLELFVQHDNQQTSAILKKFRQLEKTTLESLLQDGKIFSQQRQQRNKEFNNLLFKMKKAVTNSAAA